MKTTILMLSLWIVTASVYAQNFPKYDNVWILGRTANFGNNNGNFQLQFGNDSLHVVDYERNFNMSTTNTAMSDSLGNLLFYTNGIDIRNRNDAIMESGDTLVPCQLVQDYWVGLPSEQGVMAIPRPNYPNQYWLFASIFDAYPDEYSPLHLYASLIDMSYNNGLGKVIKKSQIILSDTLTQGGLNVVKHANGRDWWIITAQGRADSSNCYYLHLVRPDSIVYMGEQCLGSKRIKDAFTVFSPNGNWFVCTNGANGLDIFTFDRCRGTLKHQESILYTSFNPGTYTVAISPNSRYLYISNAYAGQLYQYDLSATNIESSGQLVWEHVVGQTYHFYYMALAPDGKIYSRVSSYFLDVIDKPDLQGANCNIILDSIVIPHAINSALPHFPHYRLGAEVGSDCDTLVSYQSAGNSEQLKVYPNPAQDLLHIEVQENVPIQYQVSNVVGQVLLKGTMLAKKEISLDVFPTGLYYLLLYKEGILFQSQKIIIQR